MAAPKGNRNARRGKHPRVQVPFSGTQLDALYTHLGLGVHVDAPETIRKSVHTIVHDYLRNLDHARCFSGADCLTGTAREETNNMVWCEIGACYGWYCQSCYEVKHLPKDEARAVLAATL